jgi:DNA topoisomerase VI subunit A
MVAKKVKKIKRRDAKEIGGLLESMADTVIQAAKSGDDPRFDIPVRSLSNVDFNKKSRIIEMGKNKTARQFFNLGMAKKFMQTMIIAEKLMELQRQDNLSTSLREVFYRSKHTIANSSENTFDVQDESDPVIEDLEVTLGLLREELHVRAGDTGQLVGPLTINEGGDVIDCSRQGVGGKAVPSIVEPGYVDIKKCSADFVLLIEKSTQFNRLSEDKFWKKHNCILLTGGGQPPRGVRRLARRLHDEWNLPILVLVDNDPWGYYIYSVVKQGSINLAFESQRMAIPDCKFIGLSSRDPESYGLPRNVGIKLNDKDVVRAKEIMAYPWFQKKEWQQELTFMIKSGLKYELDALANKDFRFLTTDYLPRKLKEKDWLD